MDFIKDLNIDKVRNLAEDAFNQVKPKNEVEARVYEVLSHKNWGASTTLMNEIAQDTADYERFLIVTKLMWEAIETPRPSAWRVIFKGLTLLEHLLKNGSERCVDDARNHSHLLRNLDRFNYYEGTVDRGLGVREKSKQVVEMLQDDERIREERQKARQLREKFSGRGSAASGGYSGGGSDGGGRYAGYGNSDANWASTGGGGSKGYGESGIGSGGRDSNRGYAGRYGEGDTAPSASGFASPPAASSKKSSKPSSSSETKVKKVKKKEKKVAEASAPEIDLFSFDAPATVSAPNADDTFAAFQTAPITTQIVVNDDFGDFQQIAPQSAVQFDAFGTSSTASAPQPFDAFGVGQSTQTQSMSAMNSAFGNIGLQNQQQPTMATMPPAADNDDFGDFEDADPVSVKSAQKLSDPLSKLISLDGLSKNPKKEAKPDNKPLDFSQPLESNGGGMMVGQQQMFPPQPILGTGQKGDVGEVFGQLLESGNKPAGGTTRVQQHMGMNASGGMGGGATLMGGQMYPQTNMGMGHQGMMNNTMMSFLPQGNVGMMSGHPGMMQGNMAVMGGQPGMMQGNMGMMGGQPGMMQGAMGTMPGSMGMMGGQHQMGSMVGGQTQMNTMMGGLQGQMPQVNMMMGGSQAYMQQTGNSLTGTGMMSRQSKGQQGFQ